MTRNQEIKTLLNGLKAHLKATKGDVKEAAASYFVPARPQRKKTATRTRAS